MLTRSCLIDTLLSPFQNIMTSPTFARARVLVLGTILAIGPRTVAAALRAMGMAGECHFASFHLGGRRAAEAVSRCVRPRRADIDRRRRNAGAPPGRQYRQEGRLPRSGPLQQEQLRQIERAQVGVPHASGARPVRQAHLGAALLERPCALRALQ